MPPSRSPSPASTTSSALDALLDAPSSPTLSALRAARLAELQASSASATASSAQPQASVSSPGHGTVVVLAEKEAIGTTAAAESSLLLFSHAGMAACAAMQACVARWAAKRPEVCVVEVDAEKAEWLAGRLGVRVLPVLVGFVRGKEVGRVVGFEGVQGGLKGASWKSVERLARGWGVVSGREVESESEGERERTKGRSIRGAETKVEEEDSDWD